MAEGGGYVDILNAKNKAAFEFRALGKFEESLEAYKEAYDILKLHYSSVPEHANVVIGQNNIAAALIRLERYDEASRIVTEMEEIIKRNYPGPRVAAFVQHTRAALYEKDGKNEIALRMFGEVLMIFKKEFGPNNLFTLKTQTTVAGILHRLGYNTAALQIYKTTLERKIASLGPDHFYTLHTQQSMANILIEIGKYDDALNILSDIYKTRCNTLGPDDPHTLATASTIQELKSRLPKSTIDGNFAGSP